MDGAVRCSRSSAAATGISGCHFVHRYISVGPLFCPASAEFGSFRFSERRRTKYNCRTGVFALALAGLRQMLREEVTVGERSADTGTLIPTSYLLSVSLYSPLPVFAAGSPKRPVNGTHPPTLSAEYGVARMFTELPCYPRSLCSVNIILFSKTQSGSVRAGLLRAGITRVCHLRAEGRWLTAEQVAKTVGYRSVRVFQKLLDELTTALPASAAAHMDRYESRCPELGGGPFPEVTVAAELGDWQEMEELILSFRTPQLELGAAAFGQGEGQVWAQEIHCRGNESQIDFCPTAPSQNQSCSHGNDVGLVCSDSEDVRLVDGGSPCAGRVEVFHQGRQRAGESAGAPPLSTAPGEGTSVQGEQGKNMQENVRVSSAVDETVSRSITPEQPVGEALAEPGEETSKQASGAEAINETGAEIASEVGGGEPSQTEQASGEEVEKLLSVADSQEKNEDCLFQNRHLKLKMYIHWMR
ncbi:hypothetical protein SKAU_G00275630 [Synaphobranchus kaupii]|uniref:SRCR domain-containing protein n=1 Tax=Synaphobranchus kaupii TaxID=118154 RepID=A0A9Q1IR12_SYNKA|nr:hypothetical protein SKAU_G00275630 [Synaphobranchus kaupii]